MSQDAISKSEEQIAYELMVSWAKGEGTVAEQVVGQHFLVSRTRAVYELQGKGKDD